MSSDFDFLKIAIGRLGRTMKRTATEKSPIARLNATGEIKKKEFERADFPYSGLTCCSNSYVRSMRYSVAYCSEKNIQLCAPTLAPYPVGLCGLPVRA